MTVLRDLGVAQAALAYEAQALRDRSATYVALIATNHHTLSTERIGFHLDSGRL